jgi:hypothetical protein
MANRETTHCPRLVFFHCIKLTSAGYHHTSSLVVSTRRRTVRRASYDLTESGTFLFLIIQTVKGRAYGAKAKPGQRISLIKLGAPCDTVLLVLLDNATLEAREMWEAPYGSVCECLARPGSKARVRGALSVSAFKHLPTARRVWPPPEASHA